MAIKRLGTKPQLHQYEIIMANNNIMEKIKVLVGRSSQCDFTIDNIEQHGTVSGKHATITETDTPDYFLFEDHSTNGSYINGQLLHNDSCKIKVSDHITLGKKYALPLEDIVKRFFASHRTTKKKPQEQKQYHYEDVRPQPQISHLEDETYRNSSSDTTSSLIRNFEDDTYRASSMPAVEKEIITVEKVPDWYWVLYAVTIMIAFAAGYFINNIIY